MKKECSENEVRNKAEAYCSSVERCVSEVEAKLEQWGADNGIKERVIEHLIKKNISTNSAIVQLLCAISIGLINGDG